MVIIHNAEDRSYWVRAKTEKTKLREVGWSSVRELYHCNCYDFTLTKMCEGECRHIKLVKYYRRWEPFNISILVKKIKRLNKSKFIYI